MKIDIRNLIKKYRQHLGETQWQFGLRFKATANTVSRWESGQYEPPLKVIETVLNAEVKEIRCPLCHGNGTIDF